MEDSSTMGKFKMVGSPQMSMNRLTWSVVLGPGTFEMADAGSTTDTLEVFKLTAKDFAQTQIESEHVLGVERWLPHDVLPGDTYQCDADLALHDGYYQLVLTIDANSPEAEVYQLRLSVRDGAFDLAEYVESLT